MKMPLVAWHWCASTGGVHKPESRFISPSLLAPDGWKSLISFYRERLPRVIKRTSKPSLILHLPGGMSYVDGHVVFSFAALSHCEPAYVEAFVSAVREASDLEIWHYCGWFDGNGLKKELDILSQTGHRRLVVDTLGSEGVDELTLGLGKYLKDSWRVMGEGGRGEPKIAVPRVFEDRELSADWNNPRPTTHVVVTQRKTIREEMVLAEHLQNRGYSVCVNLVRWLVEGHLEGVTEEEITSRF